MSELKLRKGEFWGRTQWHIEINNTIYSAQTKNELIEKLAQRLKQADLKEGVGK